jgi:hypothetical protein
MYGSLERDDVSFAIYVSTSALGRASMQQSDVVVPPAIIVSAHFGPNGLKLFFLLDRCLSQTNKNLRVRTACF